MKCMLLIRILKVVEIFRGIILVRLKQREKRLLNIDFLLWPRVYSLLLTISLCHFINVTPGHFQVSMQKSPQKISNSHNPL